MKTILITGATDGIGLELARLYQALGARLVLVSRRSMAELPGEFFRADNYCQVDLAGLHCAEVVVAWLREHNIEAIDLAIFNAGVGYVGSLDRQSPAAIRTLVDVNLWAPIALTHRLLPHLTVTGKLVYISSVASALPGPNYAVYTATKAALDGFARNLRLELRATGAEITVQTIFPGATRTNMHVKSGADLSALGWQRFPPASGVAEAIARAVDRSAPQVTIGALNRLVRFAGLAAPQLVDRVVMRSSRPIGGYQDPPHCVITGAADGIGRALAQCFATAGYRITGIDVDAARARQTTAELRATGAVAHFMVADLTSTAGIDAALQEFARAHATGRRVRPQCRHQRGRIVSEQRSCRPTARRRVESARAAAANCGHRARGTPHARRVAGVCRLTLPFCRLSRRVCLCGDERWHRRLCPQHARGVGAPGNQRADRVSRTDAYGPRSTL